jgi:hypothetical protein
MLETNKKTGIDFYQAQGNVGDSYFLYTIQDGEHSGGGVSCFFWFKSAKQLLDSIRTSMDFWEWRDGFDQASIDLSKIIDSFENAEILDQRLLSKLSDYTHKNAGIHLWERGTLEQLYSGYEPFSSETRREFRECCGKNDQFSDGFDEGNRLRLTDPILDIEKDLFLDFLAKSPT